MLLSVFTLIKGPSDIVYNYRHHDPTNLSRSSKRRNTTSYQLLRTLNKQEISRHFTTGP